MPLEAPAQQGDVLNLKDVLGHTMIVAPTEFIEHLPTVNTKQGEKSPAIRVNVVDFGDPDNPVIYRGALWFGVITNGLRRQVGGFLAGRVSQGQANPGKNAPWQLDDVTGEADWMAHMNNWLDNTKAGQDFQAEAIAETNRAAAAAQVAGVTAAPAPAPPAAPAPMAPPRPVAPSAPLAAPPATSQAPAPMAAPAAAPAAPVAAPAANLAAMLGGLPPEEQAKMLALLQQQGTAAH